MFDPRAEEKIVTCFYCEHHISLYTDEKCDFIKANKGFCTRECKLKLGTDKICSQFIIKSGLYTSKWYPGKK